MEIEIIILYITSLIGIFTLLFRAGLEIAKLTHTEKDDNFFNKGLKLLEWLSLNVSKLNNNVVIKKK